MQNSLNWLGTCITYLRLRPYRAFITHPTRLTSRQPLTFRLSHTSRTCSTSHTGGSLQPRRTSLNTPRNDVHTRTIISNFKLHASIIAASLRDVHVEALSMQDLLEERVLWFAIFDHLCDD